MSVSAYNSFVIHCIRSRFWHWVVLLVTADRVAVWDKAGEKSRNYGCFCSCCFRVWLDISTTVSEVRVSIVNVQPQKPQTSFRGLSELYQPSLPSLRPRRPQKRWWFIVSCLDTRRAFYESSNLRCNEWNGSAVHTLSEVIYMMGSQIPGMVVLHCNGMT
jgi:hypothetical protein